MRSTRSSLLVASLAAAALTFSACSAPNNDQPPATEVPDPGGVPDKPSEPVTLNILDVAGDQKLTGEMVDQFIKEHPDVISSVTWESGGAPDLVGMIKPQVDSGSLSIDLVMTGVVGLAAGIDQELWAPVVTDYGDRLTNMENYLEPAAEMQKYSEDQAVLTVYYPNGPLLQYDPSIVTDVPSTPEALLAWAKANPGKFGYARPANSGPGLAFLTGLPFILGDSDPTDPENGWDKTWAYLNELGTTIDNYPTGTGQVISNMADGTWAMIPTTTGWDINPRAIGQLPKEYEAAAFDDFTWVTDAHYAVIPKGQTADKLSATLMLLQYMLTPEVNAMAYDHGYFYPGPSVEGATLDMAPQESQDVIAEFGRDWYDDLIDEMPKVPLLPAADVLTATDIWDREIGSGKYEE